MPDPSVVVNVQGPIGTAWLALNWKSVAVWSLLSLFPLYFLYKRYKESTQRHQALFDFTLAETRRKSGGDAQGAQKLYSRILEGACSEDLRWRALAGKGQTLLSLGKPAEAMESVNSALTLATQVKSKREAEKMKKAKKNVTPSDESKESQEVAAPLQSAAAQQDDPDADPFLTAPISLATLHYHRGLIADALGQTEQADADYAIAVELEPEQDFIEGYVAKRRFQDRLDHGPQTGVGAASRQQEPDSIPSPGATKPFIRRNLDTTTKSSTNSPVASPRAVKQQQPPTPSSHSKKGN